MLRWREGWVREARRRHLGLVELAVETGEGPVAALAYTACAPLAARHRLVAVEVGGLTEALRRTSAPLSSMGCGLDDDPAYVLSAAAAGRHAASLL